MATNTTRKKGFNTIQKFLIVLGTLATCAALYAGFTTLAGTKIDLALKTQDSLNQGLVGYWSMDANDYTAPVGFSNLGSATYDSVSKLVSGQDTGTQGMFMKPDGKKLYLAGNNNKTIFQYTLTTAWDLSTMVYDSISKSVNGEDSGVGAVSFSPDGTQMYYLGKTNDAVYQYALSNPWDVSTASYTSLSLSVASQDGNPQGISFRPDGKKMYIVGFDNKTVFQYSLATAWNISTATYDTVSLSTNAQDVTPTEISFKPDGTKMYIQGAAADSVYQYNLTTAWDLSTASYDSVAVSANAQDTDSEAFFFSTDGTKLYVGGNTNDTIYQYSVGSTASLTDGSGNAGTGTFSTSTLVNPSTSGPMGQAIKLDGRDDYIEVSNDTALDLTGSTVTVSAWINATSTSGSAIRRIANMAGEANAGSEKYSILLRNNQVEMYIGTGSICENNDNVVAAYTYTNSWHHVVGVYDNPTMRIYIDGVLAATDTHANGGTICAQQVGTFAIGRFSGAFPQYFGGGIDDVRVYNRALGADDIKRLYQLGGTTKVAKSLPAEPDTQIGAVGMFTFDGDDIDGASTTAEIRNLGNGLGYPGDYTQSSGSGVYATSSIIAGRIGQAFKLDKSLDFIRVLKLSSQITGDFSYALWVNSAATYSGTTQGTILCEFISTSCQWNIAIGDTLAGATGDNRIIAFSGKATSTTEVADGRWHHVVVTYRGTTVSIYVDGVREDSQAATISHAAAGGGYYMGVQIVSGSGLNYYDGAIDNVALYNRALGGDEIKRLYQLGGTTKIGTTLRTQPGLDNALEGHWTFDGNDMKLGTSFATAEVRDSSGNNINGDWQKHSTTTATGRIGQGLYFDGVDDRIDLGTTLQFPSLPLTVSLWAKPDQIPPLSAILFSNNKTDFHSGVSLEFQATGLLAGVIGKGTTCGATSRTTGVAPATAPLAIGEWTHIVMIFRALSDMTLYMNGVDVGALTYSGTGNAFGYVASDSGSIGAGQGSCAPGFFKGILDDVRFYSRELSPDEINRLYKLGK